MMQYAWLVPVLPLISFLILILAGTKGKKGSGILGATLTGISFIISLFVLFDRLQGDTVQKLYTWLTIGNIDIHVGYVVNALNSLMLVIVTFVSTLVHIYSTAYMEEDDRITVFFAYLGLFTFAMLALVISPSILQLYVFWELVGLGSFLLVGFYFYKEEAKAAAKKAFIMTRIGDVGLFIGMVLLFWKTKSFDFDQIFSVIQGGQVSTGMLTLIAILIFVGAMGKSGQFPLHTWLPDAMEGPTPVSALIHAATMVAAGVYLVATTYPIFIASGTALTVVAIVGGFTAIFAASIGLVQRDIKRVLAYSTVSQLGYMMLALGVGGYTASIFHLTTHAFFKALLFLAAGSVIHAVHTQDIFKMGGLRQKMKWTSTLFLIGTLAITGVPLLSGFFSKDEILAATWENGNYVLFVVALTAAFFTSFYMFRLFFLVFTGEEKTKGAHESPMSMVLPMSLLGILAIFAGYINTPFFGRHLNEFLLDGAPFTITEHSHEPVWIMIVATLVSLAGITLAYNMYGRNVKQSKQEENGLFYEILLNKYYIDELYNGSIVKGMFAIGHVMFAIERFVIEGLALLVKGIVSSVGGIGSRLQSGQVQTYGFITLLGLALILLAIVVTGGYNL
ncbi:MULTISPECIES: NADH-quinone oxidoreductase subunit L [Bacillaceae]|uniref:NADH-quinone oxidoreductase subunit L n=1 Tax=Bacillaceae TaxID=186817 RepID=UPI000BECF985|nr:MULTISPECIES: NADH-quinone oxidoreductase subunit L [unclassified Bacillus (in: firmicutes)]PEC50476.1 NADH-quinone oxidoreductase subunit L [Bacillus sp. AFS096315]PFM81992.1 NADH-quinone oxidoreductase subunit L [Bacillus sp. AFS077874]